MSVRRISFVHSKSDGRQIDITVAICPDHLEGLAETHRILGLGDPQEGICDWCVGPREYRQVTHR